MSHGGKRDGAGRPRGSLGKRTAALLDKISAEIGNDFDPVVVLAKFAADVTLSPEFRADCAAKAAPYVHSKLKHSEVEMNTGFDPNGLAERVKRAGERAGLDDG